MTKLLAAALGISTLTNIFLAVTLHNTGKAAAQVVVAANKRAKDAEEREQARVDHILERINTSERVQIDVSESKLPPLSEIRPYISDFPYDDPHWDNHREPSE